MKVTGTVKSLGKQLLTQRPNKGRRFLRNIQNLERVYSRQEIKNIYIYEGWYLRVLSAGSQGDYQELDLSLKWV